ncbi:alpha-E domain-containing protein [Stagnihabitans tardus]|uniref:DUF403 domain-containing protein n=1 Tax=Stagnihabitans tardus TaxID=2699202 RepID=A0AAE4Y8R0_9RHOB|nr:alpha-E domain-containing protein [Stagnihabitans tardus]NBZ87026.1 hypothetical protein [Stagnihabitans tardus]
MLSRTADNLYWIARYMERAETLARLLEVGARMSLLPTAQGFRNEWESILNATGQIGAFQKKYDSFAQRNIESFLFFDRDNPSSIASCITAARENGRIVRTALTGQVWDALNTAFQELRQIERTPRSQLELSRLTDWTTKHTAMLRGAIDATLLRNDGYDFLNLGFALERADATARIIDVKYYVLLPRAGVIGAGAENDQWSMLLRALNLNRAFHWAYGGELTAQKIAHFLILNPACPRALMTCGQEIDTALTHLAKLYGRETEAQHLAQGLLQGLNASSPEAIFDEGLHDFLTRFIREIAALAGAVHDSYLSGDM